MSLDQYYPQGLTTSSRHKGFPVYGKDSRLFVWMQVEFLPASTEQVKANFPVPPELLKMELNILSGKTVPH